MAELAFQALEKALRDRKRVALTTHVAPDGDGLGSAFALRHGLAQIGVPSDVLVSGLVAARYDILDPSRSLRRYPLDIDAEGLKCYDAVVVLDCSSWSRIGALADAFPRGITRICIDHHEATAEFADVNVARREATAAAEIVQDFLSEQLHLPLDLGIALPVYLALSTETGGFAYSNTTAKCLRLAADCVEAGVKPAEVHIQLYQRESLAALRLKGRALESLQVDPTGQLAWVTLGLDDFRTTGATAQDVGGLVDYPRSLDGVEVAILAFEDEPNSVKVSMRSKSWADVHKLARQFEGGGHVRAAGALLKMPLAQAKERLIEKARALLAGTLS
jgi:phosphoesterase RecJ-like protein